MENVRAKIQDDLKTAMKAREQAKVTTIRGLLAAVKQFEVDTRTEADEAKIIQILQKEIKMRRDALSFAVEQGREDLAEQNKVEIALLQSYLGAQLSEDELRSMIQTLVTNGADTMGKIMGELNQTHKGKFEGKVASELAKQVLEIGK